MESIVLNTGRRTLSIPTERDIEPICVACQDAEIQRFTTLPSPYERRHAQEFVATREQGWSDDSEATWSICADEQVAGVVGLSRIQDGAAELGYWMAPGFRGRGLLTEAARAVIDWGFGSPSLALRRIEWHAVVGNTASARGARRLGFRYEGMRRLGPHSPRGRDDGWVAGLLSTDDRTPTSWPPLDP